MASPAGHMLKDALNLMSLFRKNIDALEAYKPGEQPIAGAKVVKLNTNENPYPPSPRAVDVLRGFDADLLRRYPHPHAQRTREAAARLCDVPPEWVLVGNGSDDLLTMIMRAASQPGRRVAFPMPTYVLYRTLAEIQDAEVVEVPFDEDYNLPLEALVEVGGAVTLIASPNSPSGNRFDNVQLGELAQRLDGLVVVDEAYVDFASGSALELVCEFENVLILRTLSKGYSLAGLRVGFAIGQPRIIHGLAKVKDSYNVDAVADLVAAAAIDDQAHKDANAEQIKASRAALAEQLEALGFRVWSSESNFLLVRPSEGNAEQLYLGLKKRGILVRYFKQPRLDDKLRITVGTEQDNATLVAALGELLRT